MKTAFDTISVGDTLPAVGEPVRWRRQPAPPRKTAQPVGDDTTDRDIQDSTQSARYWLIALLAVWSLWAPILWLTVMALGDGSNLIDPPSEWYFRGRLLYPVLSLLTAAAYAQIHRCEWWGAGAGHERHGDGIGQSDFGRMAPVVGLWSARGAAHEVAKGSK